MHKTTILVGIIIILLVIQGWPFTENKIGTSKSWLRDSDNEDTDGDSVPDADELKTYTYNDYYGFIYKLNPNEYDSWYDGLSDGQKVSLGLVDGVDAKTEDMWRKLGGDVDGDGLRDDIEIALGLDPLNSDTDGDWLEDLLEITFFHTDPLNPDTDGDGLLDGIEVQHRQAAIVLEYDEYYPYGYYYGPDDFTLPEDTDPLNPDTDGDGLSDGEEYRNLLYSYDYSTGTYIRKGPIPTIKDTDGDGLDDYHELEMFSKYYYTNDPFSTADYDGDGLSDYDEWLLGTNPTHDDTDLDWVKDPDEVAVGTDPLKKDTDGDGIDDQHELEWACSNPTMYDSDGDGLNDLQEIQNGTDPFLVDTDGDTIDDYYEIVCYETDPTKIDSDGDGLNDSYEIQIGTNPISKDSDGDGLYDPEELQVKSDPNNPDTDGDGLNDNYEAMYGTIPTNSDSDNDGLNDYQEMDNNTDPFDPDTDGDGISDGSDPDPGTSDYWSSYHYLPAIWVYFGSSGLPNLSPGDYLEFAIILRGNLGEINITVQGSGKVNRTGVYYNGTGNNYIKLNLTVLPFHGNSEVIRVQFTPENGDIAFFEVNAVNPKPKLNVSPSILPLKFPSIVYFNFTHKIRSFALEIPHGIGEYRILEIKNRTAKVEISLNQHGRVDVTVEAEMYNASDYHSNYTFIVGEDEFAKYEDRLNHLLEKVRRYINVSVNIDPIRERYYSGDESALEELKSIVRVEALTLTAAVMLEQFVDSMATTAVDVISFKTLLNILVDKLKESEIYGELADYIVDKINSLVSKIVNGMELDRDLVDQLVDEITEKAGEALDSTIQEYRDKMKDKFVEWMYEPLKNAHDEIVYQYMSENESKERRLKIYGYAEEGVGMMNALSTLGAVASSIEETSSTIASLINGLPAYETALKILEKAAEILATSANALEKFEVARTMYNILSAYKGESYKVQESREVSDYVVIYETGGNGDILAKYGFIIEENYTVPAVVIDQVKMTTYIMRFLSGNGTIYMLNSSAERYMVSVEKYVNSWDENLKKVYIDAPRTVIAGKKFNISVRTNFNATITLGNTSIYGNNLTITLFLELGEHSIELTVNDFRKTIKINAVNLTSLNWSIVGDVLYYVDPNGDIIAINSQYHNATPEELLNETANTHGEENTNGDTSGNSGTEESEGSRDYTVILLSAAIIALIVATAVILIKKKKKM